MIGILGGGQLGRFLVNAAREWDIECAVLDPDPEAPAGKIAARFETGNLTDSLRVLDFARGLDLLTVEIENVSADALEELATHIRVHPSASVLRIVQDKGIQKDFYRRNNIPTAPYRLISSREELPDSESSYPLIVKQRRGGYDGRGVKKINSPADRSEAFAEPSVQEECISIDQEISVIVSRNEFGQMAAFPAVEMVPTPAHVLDYLLSPARITEDQHRRANEIAFEIAELIGLVGILAVEMFISNDQVLVNEIAPRPHNSGHATIEANMTSQYEQHLRMILGHPPGPTDSLSSSALLNLLGQGDGTPLIHGMREAMGIPGVSVHMYGKRVCKPGRKMGHVTVLAPDRSILLERIELVRSVLRVGPQ